MGGLKDLVGVCSFFGWDAKFFAFERLVPWGCRIVIWRSGNPKLDRV